MRTHDLHHRQMEQHASRNLNLWQTSTDYVGEDTAICRHVWAANGNRTFLIDKTCAQLTFVPSTTCEAALDTW